MKLSFKYFFGFIIVVFLLVSCANKPNYPNEPYIEFVSFEKNVADQGDQIWVNLSFTDGDGDLGQLPVDESTCGSHPINLCTYETDSSCYKDPYWSVFLINVKDSCFGTLNLPSFEPDGNVKDVSGELQILTPPLFCKNIGAFSIDTVVYKVVVRDAAGNYSNAVLTDTLYINCN